MMSHCKNYREVTEGKALEQQENHCNNVLIYPRFDIELVTR